MVPLANMFGYVNTLRSMSQGRAQYTMHFDHYEQVPQAVADEAALQHRDDWAYRPRQDDLDGGDHQGLGGGGRGDVCAV